MQVLHATLSSCWHLLQLCCRCWPGLQPLPQQRSWPCCLPAHATPCLIMPRLQLVVLQDAHVLEALIELLADNGPPEEAVTAIRKVSLTSYRLWCSPTFHAAWPCMVQIAGCCGSQAVSARRQGSMQAGI